MYFTYNTLHTHTRLNKARYSYTQLYRAIHSYTEIYRGIHSYTEMNFLNFLLNSYSEIGRRYHLSAQAIVENLQS